MMRTAPRCKRRRDGEIILDAEEASLRRDRLHRRGSAKSDGSLHTALRDAAHIMLTKPLKGCSQLKSWAMRTARRTGMSKAKVGSPADWR
jgi:hypothetical protein